MQTTIVVHNGHLIEGIFRVAPNHEECKQIEDRLNDGQLLKINFGAVDGDLIANLIKLWYRQLPLPVLQSLIKTNKIETCKTKDNEVDKEQQTQTIFFSFACFNLNYLTCAILSWCSCIK